MNWINWPIEIKLYPEGIEIDGVQLTRMAVAEIISQIIHPDPRKWYRMERTGNIINFHLKMTEEEPDGTRLGNTGESSEDPGGTGTEAAHP